MLEDLVLAGGGAVVGAMATDGWQVARTGVTRLFRRGSDEEAAGIERQLDSDAERVARAEDAERVRNRLLVLWAEELETLVRRHPVLEQELQALIDEIRAATPQAEPRVSQHNYARDNSQQYNTINGNVIVHHGTPAERATEITGEP
ncbi:hypothetical protein [Streptomyces buecherae]|uniref:hypothetical protein n=1 Tax=Streptomyces buecherae TaxID=2763006 RepID=UPI001C27496B|nr:hypothetical protein [Streptomyces buecherae]